MMQTAPDVISIFEKLGTPVAFVLLGTWIFYKVIWPAKLKREEKQDEIRATDAARIAAVLDDQIKWARARFRTWRTSLMGCMVVGSLLVYPLCR